ncbi:hypothetical protein GF377_01525 [candidate division GN15 bacterium]|nr:hypothetical protein [candidate division GN15 bacterium]
MFTRTRNLDYARRHPATRLGVTAVLTAALTLMLLPTPALPDAMVHSSARAAAMSGAYTALAKGVDAAKYNPANLGLTGYRQTGLEFVAVGANIANNSFTLSDYNDYTGAVLTTADKEDILGKIPTEGLSIDADVSATAMSLAMGSFALSTTGYGSADVNLNKDIIDLVLNGNTFADSIEVTGSYSEGVSYAAVALSFGTPLLQVGKSQLAAGITAKYIKGIAIEEMVELEGLAATYEDGFQGQGRAVFRTATGGSGYALDLGAAWKFNDHYTVGARLQNFLGSISWSDDTEEHGYIFEYDAATVDDFEEDDYVGSDDYSKEIDGFSTSLPTSLNIGFARTSGTLIYSVDWIQGLETNPGTTTKPILAFGGEYTALGFLPLRAGYSLGGGHSPAFSFGSGVSFLGFYLDAAVFTGTSMTLYSAKGAKFAVSTGLRF